MHSELITKEMGVKDEISEIGITKHNFHNMDLQLNYWIDIAQITTLECPEQRRASGVWLYSP